METTQLSPRDAAYLGVRTAQIECQDCGGLGYQSDREGFEVEACGCLDGAARCGVCETEPAIAFDQMPNGKAPLCLDCAGLSVGEVFDFGAAPTAEVVTPIVFVCGQCYSRPGVTEVSSVSRAGFSVSTDCCAECAQRLTGRVAA